MTDKDYMQKALTLARRGKGLTSPNPMVGALLVKGGKIIAQGWHRRCGSDHAEIVALKKAGRAAKGAILYVTLEPCYHVGRTPPCVDAIIRSGVKMVVIGMKDPNPATHGKSIAKLRQAHIKTHVGVLQKDLEQLNEAFIKYIKHKLPFVVAKCAQSLDGKIACTTGHSQWITSPQTRRYARGIRDEFDAICVGINTVLKDNPRLNGKKKTKRLKKIVLDSSLRLSPQSRLFAGAKSVDCFMATTTKAPQRKVEFFRKKGINVLICPQRKGNIQLKWLLKELARREVTSLLLEGGARLIGDALKENLVDKMHIFVAPKIMGDHRALSSVVGLHCLKVSQAKTVHRLTVRQISRDFLFEGYVYRNR